MQAKRIKNKSALKKLTSGIKEQKLEFDSEEIHFMIRSAKLAELKLSNSFLTKCFQSFFNNRLNKIFQYISTIPKLKDVIPLVKKYLLREATLEYFESNDGKLLIEQYNSTKNKKYFNPDYYQKIIPVFSNKWIDEYLKPINLMLILFSKDKDSMYQELEKLFVRKKQNKSGRTSVYTKYFPSMKLVQEYLEKKYGRRIRENSDDTTAVKHVLKHAGIPFKHSAVTAYNNWKNKISHKPRSRKIH